MEEDRTARVRAAIEDQARAAGAPVSILHVCQACARLVAAKVGVGVLRRRLGVYEPVCASEPLADAVAELQITVGEGPGITVLEGTRPVLVPDLGSLGYQRRWPLFAPAAAELGVRALFAFPLRMGTIAVGVMQVVRDRAGPLSQAQLADALVFADAAVQNLLLAGSSPEGARAWATGDDGGMLPDVSANRWPEVHQATGMVSVQLGVDMAEALLRLRAKAFATGRGLREVARDVVARRLRFRPDQRDGG